MTLVESVLATGILAIAVLALTEAVVRGQTLTYEALHSGRAIALINGKFEEILAEPYDNMSIFDGQSEAAGTLQSANGTAYDTTYQRFSRSCQITADTVSVAAFGEVVAGMRVEVTVTDDRGLVWSVDRFVPQPY